MTSEQTFKKLETKLAEIIEEHLFTDGWADSDERMALNMQFDDSTAEEMAEAAVLILAAKENLYRWLESQNMIND